MYSILHHKITHMQVSLTFRKLKMKLLLHQSGDSEQKDCSIAIFSYYLWCPFQKVPGGLRLLQSCRVFVRLQLLSYLSI